MRTFLTVLGLVMCLSAPASVVDRVVVVVEDQLILQSDIELEAVVASLDKSTSPFWDRNPNDPRERLIEAAILRHLAGDVALYQPGEEEVRSRAELVRRRFESRAKWLAFLNEWGMDETALRSTLRRRMVTERYVGRNLQVDPQNRQIWLQTCDTYMAQVRPRIRIRVIESANR
jgi:hypothetical protein